MRKVVVWKLPASKIEGRVLPFEYESDAHYAVKVAHTRLGWSLVLRKESLRKPMRKREREVWTRAYKGNTEIYAAFDDGEEAGLVQLEHQEWNRSLRVWDILVHPGFRRRGIGTALLDKCKERARVLGARRVILETQSCNVAAVDFYLANGFELVGLDLTNYSNDDVEKGEVRLEMGWNVPGKRKAK